MKFSELHLNGNVLEALDAMRFEECTPIQEQSIPVILEGRDLIAVAQTGTGKATLVEQDRKKLTFKISWHNR